MPEATPAADITTTDAPTEPASALANPAAEGAGPPGDPTPEAAEDKEVKVKNPSKLLARQLRLKGQNKATEARLAQARADFEKQQAQAQADIQESKQIKQLLAQLREDPDAVAEALGLDYDSWTAKRLRQGHPDEKIAALQKQIADDRKAREDEKKAESERAEQAKSLAQQAHYEQATAAFVEKIKAEGAFPETALYSAETIVQMGEEMAARLYKARGSYASHDEIATELEKQLAKNHALIRGGSAPAAEPAPGKKPPARPLTNKAAVETTGKGRELTEKERLKLAARMLDEGKFGL